MNKKLLFLITGLMFFLSSYSQCAYTGTPLTSVGTYTFCIDTPGTTNTITTATTRSGQYALVNVVQGFTYRFAVGNIFSGVNENLTIINAADDSNFGAGGFVSNGNGATITSWTSPISGQIKVLLSSGSCINDNTAGGVLTLTLMAVGNTLDSQTTFGTDSWVGHVYDWTGTAPPGGSSSPISPATTTPFTAANYVGYYNIGTETINENFGGGANCFQVLSNGSNRTNINTELFSVRYRMRSTRPAGCYILNVNGDDGIRVYVDGVLVFSRWVQQGNTSYCNNLINLTGNSEIILDYYENSGGNVLGFSLNPFDGSGNAITSSTDVRVCSNTASTITASNLISCNVNTNTVYQWQSSLDNISFTNITTGGTARDYTAPALGVAAGSPNNIRYFRRVFKPSTLTAGTCEFFSNVVTVTTSGARPNGPGAISGNTTQCRTTSASYNIAAVLNATGYSWGTTGTGWTITPSANGLSVSIAFSATATSGNLTVFASNGCGQSFSNSSVNIQVGGLPTNATISGSTAVCVGAPAQAIVITNPQSYGVNVTYNINGGANNVVYVGPSSSINYITAPTVSAGTFTYNLVSVSNGVGFANCSTSITGNATVTVNPPSVGGTVSGGTAVCSGTNSTVLTLEGHTGTVVRWESSLDNFATAGITIADTSTTLTVANLSATTSYRAVLQSGSCSVVNSSSATVTVNPPSVGGTVSGGTTVCSGTNSTVLTLAGHIGTITKWQSAVSPFSTWTDIANTAATYTTGSLSATTQFRAVVQSGSCAVGNSAVTTITVNSAPTITPNKVDETCATTNDGSISPTLFGGLTNVRYIKLTQKFVNADAWQQVQEIQALEVFTGSNVALSSTGAIATSSSIYNNDPGTFGPAKVNDGDTVGYSFWHSNSTNINEWVQVDLQSGKNIDYLRIYNRSDCCQNRGQNMLLELFDGANNLVYSRTVNLWENINGPHYIEVNILDLSWADGATTLNRTSLDSGTYTLNYADALGCSASSPINIGSSIIAAPTQGTITPITCNVPVASVILNNLPSVGTWTLTQSGTSTATITGTGSSATISGLAPGTYNFSVSIGGCSSSNLEAVEIASLQETVWNGAWSNGLPNSDKKLIFNSNYSQTTDLVACSCEVTLGNVIVRSDKTLTLTNELKVSGGTLTFENNANLVQINEDPTINSGAITYQRETVTPVDKFDFTYWTSPVFGQTLYNTSPNTLADKYFSFDAVNNNWIQENSLTKVMEPGIGYIIRGPQNNYAPNPIGTYRANFIGVPHNGTIPVAITATGEASYLLGNPYPSALDADLFLFNNKDVLDGTLYFWTHNTDIAPSGSHYIYDSDDYASYNLTGGVGTGNGIPADSDVNPMPTIPAGEIASGQGFFATSIAPGTVNYTNTMRLGGIANSQFFRSNSKSKKNASFDKNRLWLNFSNTEGAFKQTLIGYITGATNEYERTFDGISFDGNTFVDFYSILEDKNFVIQGRALPFLQSDEVPLGYKTTIKGNFTITIFQTDGFLTAQNVFLEDKMLGVIHNLKEAAYNFTTEKGVFNERFVLRYTDKTLGTGDFESDDKTLVVFKEKNELKIKSEFETMKRVTIFDLLGKKVFEETLKDVNEFRTSNITLKNQIVIVKVVLTNGQVVAKKVSY